MPLAQRFIRLLISSIATVSALALACPGTAQSDPLPLLGPDRSPPSGTTRSATSVSGTIVPVDPDSVPCLQSVTFSDLPGGDSPGTSYDGVVWSGGLQFAERFMGQALGYSGVFDVVTGTPAHPLELQAGLPGENLDVFTYTTNVMTGLGPLGSPDMDAIGEGSIAMYFPTPQSRVGLQLVGGNGGSATLGFYRADGSLIDNVVVSGLGELQYGFATSDGSKSIVGILLQNTDPSGIGLDNICYDGGVVSTRGVTWGSLKMLYR